MYLLRDMARATRLLTTPGIQEDVTRLSKMGRYIAVPVQLKFKGKNTLPTPRQTFNRLDLSDAQMLWGPEGRAVYESIVYDCLDADASDAACNAASTRLQELCNTSIQNARESRIDAPYRKTEVRTSGARRTSTREELAEKYSSNAKPWTTPQPDMSV